MHQRTVRLIGLLLVALLLLTLRRAEAAPTLPNDFSDTLVASLASPTALAFTPDGRMLITSQLGKLSIYQNGTLLATPVLDLGSRICTNSERGVLGVAVDPNFTSNRSIYLYYSFKKSGVCPSNSSNCPVNRVARFKLGTNNVVDPASEVVLIDNIPSPNGNHNAGDLHFGKDGYLYISIGDGGCDYLGNSGCGGSNDASRDQNVLLGKIVRITRDGAIPSTNPFRGTDSARCNTAGRTDPGKKCQETFAWGLRNPFRLAFDPNASDTQFRINDVGQGTWEEIDVGQAGVDYGWSVREGHCANNSTTDCGTPPAGMTNPIFDYGHSTGCASITGGAFVPNGLWPASYNNTYLYGDYVCGKIFKLSASGGNYTPTDFVTGLGTNSAVHLAFGPYNRAQALFYTSYANGGEIHRISYTGTLNRAPTAAFTASPSSGVAPLALTFDASASSDPDAGDTLTYLWNWGDGTSNTIFIFTSTSDIYTANGTYTAQLTVRDNHGTSSAPVTRRIDVGNTPPVPTITSPATTLRFRVGQTITLTGSATDAEDGTLPPSALTWTVTLHHDTHTHPFLPPTTGNNITITAPAPEDLAAAATSYLTIDLRATDGQGLSATTTQDVQPHRVDVTFNTQPSGLNLNVNSTTITAPRTLTSWENYALNVNAPDQSDSSGQPFTFAAWSDGGAAAHTITTPASPATYSATFQPSTGGTGLSATYYDNIDFTGTTVRRTDATVNFDWGTGSPASGIDADTFSARWIGYVQPRYSETYRFYTTSDDGVRLWINGQQLIDNWTNHGPTENSATIALTAGQRYPIQIDYYERNNGAVAKLAWSSASQAKQIVPQSQLYPQASFSKQINFQPAGAAVPAGYLADTGATFADRGNGTTYGWNSDNSAQTRDRNASSSPDQRYDTLTHLQKSANPNAVWEIAVPNGTYTVRLVAGDATAYDSVFKLNVEGALALSGTPTSSARWIEATAVVTVTDGRLTVSNAPGASNNKLCFIEISAN